MALLSASQKFVDDFFRVIDPLQAAFQHSGFAYLALKIADRFILVQGRVFLNTAKPSPLSRPFESENVRAGHCSLAELKLDVRSVVDQILKGKLSTPHGDLFFP